MDGTTEAQLPGREKWTRDGIITCWLDCTYLLLWPCCFSLCPALVYISTATRVNPSKCKLSIAPLLQTLRTPHFTQAESPCAAGCVTPAAPLCFLHLLLPPSSSPAVGCLLLDLPPAGQGHSGPESLRGRFSLLRILFSQREAGLAIYSFRSLLKCCL